MSATVAECFVWFASEIGTVWRNFGYTGVTGIVKVCNLPPAGNTLGLSERTYEEFAVNVDYQISGDTIRLISNAKTVPYGYPDDSEYGAPTHSYQIWVTYTISDTPYAPSPAVIAANDEKIA